jgi:outer membrane receptor protein involved in Fe transport
MPFVVLLAALCCFLGVASGQPSDDAGSRPPEDGALPDEIDASAARKESEAFAVDAGSGVGDASQSTEDGSSSADAASAAQPAQDVSSPSGLDTSAQAAAPPEPTPADAASSQAPIEVMVFGAVGKTSRVETLRRSAQAVQVVDTKDAKRRSADLGEVIARASGVGVRRSGGLGSEARISLNGLTDDQIRFFLEGVPLDLAGFPFGLANVPVNLVNRVEIYRGVVPAQFGADALGGAINLVGDEGVHGTHGSISYQGGSFDTHRLSLEARDLRPPSGFFSRVQGFFDTTRNDYRIEAEAEDANNRPQPVTVHRFHDGYRAAGGVVELGFVRRPWADKLLLRMFLADYHKELQNTLGMSRPYGAVTYGDSTSGASLRYQHTFAEVLRLQAIAGFTYSRPTFRDVNTCIFDWYGRCVANDTPGETDRRPHDQVFREDNVFARVQLEWEPIRDQVVRISAAPTFFTRTGDERRPTDPSERDPLSAERRLLSVVGALEHQMSILGDRLENVFAVKHYVLQGRAEDTSPGANFRELKRDAMEWGVSDALRLRLHAFVYAKASYERATRLPRPDEIFGDNILIASNLSLLPERSHNANLSLALDTHEIAAGMLRAELNGFLRDTDRLIQLLGADRAYSYQNVASARSVGMEASAGWTSPGEYFSLDGNVTYQSLRNTSRGSLFEGDRIPNRPYLFANGAAQLKLRESFAARDELTLSWNTRYVHAFFRGWESAGIRDGKAVIPAQLSHALALGYTLKSARSAHARTTFTLEAQNLTNANLYDYYGVQRPGRAAFARATLEF